MTELSTMPGGAIAWWLFWFLTALVLYGVLSFWFTRHALREDRELATQVDAESPEKRSSPRESE
jgi:cbb3-type cytochrome oxidase subunit 3